MDVNKIKITAFTNSQEIVVPLDMQWDLVNREDSVISEEKNIIEKVIGIPPNYELVRFSRRPRDLSLNSQTYGGFTEVVYRFNFYSGTSNTWENTYLTRFDENQVRFSSDSFKNSFFKFDLYDTTNPTSQRIYLSIILNTNQSRVDTPICSQYRFNSIGGELSFIDCCGDTVGLILNPGQLVTFCPTQPQVANYIVDFGAGPQNIPINIDGTEFPPPGGGPIIIPWAYGPTGSECSCDFNSVSSSVFSLLPDFTLDHYGDQKGYYIHWYEDETLLNISELYMRVKFFDGNTGTYTTFTVNPQSSYVNQYRIPNDDFYVRVPFFYDERWYDLIDINTNNILTICNWYEYTNPPLI